MAIFLRRLSGPGWDLGDSEALFLWSVFSGNECPQSLYYFSFIHKVLAQLILLRKILE